MCGIVCAFETGVPTTSLRPQILAMSGRIRHRGPDWSGIYCGEKAVMAHERLSIVDPASGRQPLFSDDRRLVLAVNGEIYNHQALRQTFEGRYPFRTHSDCEVILPSTGKKGPLSSMNSTGSSPLPSMTRRRTATSSPATTSASYLYIWGMIPREPSMWLPK